MGYGAKMLRVYAYKKCGTCRKALKWLTERGIDFEEIDITVKPPTKKELERALKEGELPLAKLFNTSGQSYRQGNFKSRLPAMSRAEALSALSQDGRLVKRPLVLGDGFALVGFDEARYRAKLGA
jgi:arsenate reductase